MTAEHSPPAPFAVRDTGLGVITVTGADALSFLHGQLSCDCRLVTSGQAASGAWCDPKGRVLFVLQLVATADGYYLLAERERIAALIKRLRMFVLRASVVLSDATDTLAVAGLQLAEAPAGVALSSVEPTTAGALRIWTEPTAARCLVVGDAAAVDATVAAAELPQGSADDWLTANILAGWPRIGEAGSGEFLPQHLNLDWWSGVSFTKGCYPGQEVVARLNYRGTVKQRLLAARGAVDGLAPGDRVRPTGADPKAAVSGKVLTVARNHDALVVAVVADVALETGSTLDVYPPESDAARPGTLTCLRPPIWPA